MSEGKQHKALKELAEDTEGSSFWPWYMRKDKCRSIIWHKRLFWDHPCHRSSRSSKAAKHCRVVYSIYITLFSFIYSIVCTCECACLCACLCFLTCAVSHESWGQAVCDATAFSQDKRHSLSLLPVQILLQSKSLCLCACASKIE